MINHILCNFQIYKKDKCLLKFSVHKDENEHKNISYSPHC